VGAAFFLASFAVFAVFAFLAAWWGRVWLRSASAG